MKLIRTGVKGLDHVLQGGIAKGHSVLLQGTPGAGKTTLGLQFIYEGAAHCDEPGLAITFEEFPQQMYRDALNFGWDLRALEGQNKLRIISTSPSVFQQQMQDPQGLIQRMASDLKVQRILVDSVTHFQRITTDQVAMREMLNSFLNTLKQGEYTTVLTQEVALEEGGHVSFEQYVVDAVIRISFAAVKGLERRRFVEVLKARGQEFMYGKHSVQLGNQGIRVFPRPQPQSRRDDQDRETPHVPTPGLRKKTGIGGLDRMLEGGLIDGSSTLVAGDAGTAKTNFALHFLAAGAEDGEPGLLIALRDSYDKLIRSAASIGLDLQDMAEKGLLTVVTRSPVNIDPDELYWDVYQLLEEKSFRRAVLDSLTDVEPTIDDEKRFRDYVYAFVDLFSRHGITSLLTRQAAESPEERELVESELSMVFDVLVSLRLRRIQDHIRKTMCLLKVRGTDHDTGVRQFKVTSRGIQVETRFEGTTAFLRTLQLQQDQRVAEGLATPRAANPSTSQ